MMRSAGQFAIFCATVAFLSACSPSLEEQLLGEWERSYSVGSAGSRGTQVLRIESAGKYELANWVEYDDATAVALRARVDQLPKGGRLEGNRLHDRVQAGLWRLEDKHIAFEGRTTDGRAFSYFGGFLFRDGSVIELTFIGRNPEQAEVVFKRKQAGSK